MDYNELYDVLKFNFDQNKDWINIKELNITIEKVPFVSQSAQYLFTSEAHHCDEHQQVFSTREKNHKNYGFDSVDILDRDIQNNINFSYYIIS